MPERELNMKFTITNQSPVANQYKGFGEAFAAINNGEVVGLAYFVDPTDEHSKRAAKAIHAIADVYDVDDKLMLTGKRITAFRRMCEDLGIPGHASATIRQLEEAARDIFVDSFGEYVKRSITRLSGLGEVKVGVVEGFTTLDEYRNGWFKEDGRRPLHCWFTDTNWSKVRQDIAAVNGRATYEG